MHFSSFHSLVLRLNDIQYFVECNAPVRETVYDAATPGFNAETLPTIVGTRDVGKSAKHSGWFEFWIEMPACREPTQTVVSQLGYGDRVA